MYDMHRQNTKNIFEYILELLYTLFNYENHVIRKGYSNDIDTTLQQRSLQNCIFYNNIEFLWVLNKHSSSH